MHLSRRAFIGRASLAAAATCFSASHAAGQSRRKLFSAVGITAQVERATELKACGADFIVESVARFLVPDKPDAEFEPLRAKAAASALPILGCNNFIRNPKLRCTGPDATHPELLEFSEIVFRRLRQVGGEYLVFGSNNARQLPEGWPREKADEQFISLLKQMGPLAAKHKILVGVEPQQVRECNYLNHIGEVAAVVSAANHPNIRVLADLYHMAIMGDTPEDLGKAMPWVGVVELAEKERRTLPGMMGDDFRPYFTALAQGGYSGRMDIESSAGTTAQLKAAFETIDRQAQDALRVAGKTDVK